MGLSTMLPSLQTVRSGGVECCKDHSCEKHWKKKKITQSPDGKVCGNGECEQAKKGLGYCQDNISDMSR